MVELLEELFAYSKGGEDSEKLIVLGKKIKILVGQLKSGFVRSTEQKGGANQGLTKQAFKERHTLLKFNKLI